MAELIGSLKEGLGVLRRKDDDAFDRISNSYTVAVFLFCSLFLATKSYVGDPIDCYTPKEFEDNWIAYTDNYCWIKNTYYVPLDQNLPSPGSSRAELPYYQWVPIIIAFMLLVMSIPVFFWSFAMAYSGYDIESVVKASKGTDSLNPETRDKTQKYLIAQLDRHLTYHRPLKNRGVKIGNEYGRFLYIMYIITKILYIAMPVLLFFILNGMMGEGYSDYGIRAVGGLIRDDGSYIENPMFPRVTFCDFKIRRMGQNIHPYTVQCVLTVNLFNEKVFLIIWWWLVFVISMSCIGLIVLLLNTMMPSSSTNFIRKFLCASETINPNSEKEAKAVRNFANDYLRMDGVFCMRLLSKNVKDVVAAEIVSNLYKNWREQHYEKMAAAEGPLMGSRQMSEASV